MKNNKPICYVDMDDTITAFEKARVAHIEKTPSIRIPWCKMDFFRKLEPIEGAIEGINKLTEWYDVWILTRPSVHNPLCYTEKRLWVEDHLGFEWCKKLILCPDKSLMKGDLLIDDVKWNFDGEQLLFGSSACPNWKSVVEQARVLKLYFEKDEIQANEVLFKAKLVSTGEWIIGTYHYSNDGKYHYILNREKFLERDGEMALHNQEVHLVDGDSVIQIS